MSKQTYAIDTGDGVQLAAGISAHEIDRVAQERADRLGESVWVYRELDDDLEAREVRPTEVEVEATCECGGWAEERCRASAPASEMVVVDWMPGHLRATVEAAGATMRPGMPGAVRARVAPACARHMLEVDGEWCAEVSK